MGFECDPPEIIAPGAKVGIFVERRVGEPAVVVAHPVSEFVDSGRIEPARFGVVAQGPEHGVALGAVVVPADAVVDAEPVVGCEKDPAAVPPSAVMSHTCVWATGSALCAKRSTWRRPQRIAAAASPAKTVRTTGSSRRNGVRIVRPIVRMRFLSTNILNILRKTNRPGITEMSYAL